VQINMASRLPLVKRTALKVLLSTQRLSFEVVKVRACRDRARMRSTNGDHTMSATTLTNNQAALSYALSELGEVMTLSADTTTVGTKRANNGAVVLSPGTSIATAKVHCAAVHPALAAGQIKD
jgi:hypothetical protein